MALSLGTRLGPYEIVAPLGAGGMGEVYRARDPRLGRDVAIKVLPAAVAHDAERLRRFEQEARAAGALNHPHLLAVFDVGSHDGSPYVVSELLQGGTLRDRLAGGALPPRKAVEIGAQIARGLAAAHDKGIVHRDLKPENVFVANDGHVKILDFGLAKLTQPAAETDASALATEAPGTEAGTILGTVGYMSPEQVRGQAADHRSDLFSCGAILYEMLAGRRAFRRNTSAETLAAILGEDPPDLAETCPAVAPGLERIVRHCLEKSPEERFASAHDLAFDLQALSDVGTRETAAARWGRRRVLQTLAMVVTWTAVVAAHAFWLGRSTRQAPDPTYRQLTFRRGTVTAARFSPDETYFFYSARWGGARSRVYSTRIEVAGEEDLGLEGELVGAAAGEVFVLRPDHVLVRATLSGAGAREVADGVERADVSRDGSTIAVVRRTGGKQRLELPPGRPLYETTGQITELRLSPDGREVAFTEEPNANVLSSIIRVVAPGGSPRTVTSMGPHAGLVWSPHGSELWYTTSPESWALSAASLAGGERVLARTAQRPQVLDAASDGRVILSLGEARFEIAGSSAGEARERDMSWLMRQQVYDLSADGTTAVVVAPPSGDGIQTYLVRRDGSAPIRLGPGFGNGLSPDGRFVAVLLERAFTALALLPTGAGETKSVARGPIRYYYDVRWLPDGRRLLIAGNEEGRPRRLFLQEIGGGPPRPVTPEGVGTDYPIPSPDGEWVAAGTDWRLTPYALYPLEGGEPRPIRGLEKGEEPLRFDADGTHLFVRTGDREQPAALIARLDLRTGRREPWREIRPLDPSGVSDIFLVYLTPEGRSYVYNRTRDLSALYLVEGLR